MSLYRNLLAQAWKNTWEHKYLWFFGLFAALVGASEELNLLFSGSDNTVISGFISTVKGFWATGVFSPRGISNLGKILVTDSYDLLIALTILAIFFLLLCFLIWFAIVCQVSLVNNYARIIGKKNHSFADGLDVGVKKFWPVFGFNVILKVIIWTIYLLLALPIILLYDKVSSWQLFIFITTYLVFIPLSIIVAFIIKYATAYVVVKGEKFADALQLSWELFLKNWLISIEMAFILFGISFVVTFGLFLALATIAIPYLFLVALLPTLATFLNVGLLLFCGLIFALLIIMVVGSWLSAFTIAAWTGLFLELISRGGVSKIVRIFSKE
jgi:hypothetical protein